MWLGSERTWATLVLQRPQRWRTILQLRPYALHTWKLRITSSARCEPHSGQAEQCAVGQTLTRLRPLRHLPCNEEGGLFIATIGDPPTERRELGGSRLGRSHVSTLTPKRNSAPGGTRVRRDPRPVGLEPAAELECLGGRGWRRDCSH